MELKRDLLCNYLSQAGIQAVKLDGGLFIVADISQLGMKISDSVP